MVAARSNTERIQEKAHSLGFSHLGIARAEALDSEGGLLEQWLSRRYNADMEWMARNVNKRIDPREVVPGANSILVATYNYYTPHEHSRSPEHGKISRYAWGEDYHEVVTPKLKELEELLDSLEEGITSRSYVDTGPVMEKAWAVRAGIGWLGKHTNLITRDYGSWVFLGVIITTLKLEYNAPISDFCGSCTACIDACPTNAIVEPYVVDSNRCISYLTIECKDEELPATDRMDFRNWIFGCDICQDVCPWNRFQQETADERFQPLKLTKSPLLEDILEMTQEQYGESFRNSPLKRTKLKGLKRNARIVLDLNESNYE